MNSNENIQLSATELISQSESLRNLKEEYSALFSSVRTTLSDMNEGWSENLANNFIGKIATAQKGFAKIVEMLECGENVARETATSFEDINAVMARTLVQDLMNNPLIFPTYDPSISNGMGYESATIYQDSMGMVHTHEAVEAAKARIAAGTATKTDFRIASAEAVIVPMSGVNWQKQDLFLQNGNPFTLQDPNFPLNKDVLSTLANLEGEVFGTDYLSKVENVLNGFDSLKDAPIFENSFNRFDELKDSLTAILSGDLTSSQIDSNMANLINNFSNVQDTMSEGNFIEAALQSTIYANQYTASETVSGLFGALEDNLEIGKVASEFLGLGKYGNMVDQIQTGIEDLIGMDLSELGDHLSLQTSDIYQTVGDNVPNILNTLQDIGDGAICGVGDAFENIGSLLSGLF